MNNKDYDLLKDIETRFKTTMIGSLAKFEQYFGHLWDNDSDEALEYEKLWDQARNAILNNGNNQIRLALDDLSDHLISNSKPSKPSNFREKYRYEFYFNKNGENK